MSRVVHPIMTHTLARGLLRRPNTKVIGVTLGPVSLLWDRSFKHAEKERSTSPICPRHGGRMMSEGRCFEPRCGFGA